jgi:uncharacterized protein
MKIYSKFLRIFFILFTLYASHSFAHADSLNCNKISTNIEQLICNNSEITKLHSRMVELYEVAFKVAPEIFKTEQNEWLKQRDSCENISCLKEKYEDRINGLDNFVAAYERDQALAKPGAAESKTDSINVKQQSIEKEAEANIANKESNESDSYDLTSIIFTVAISCLVIFFGALFIKKQIRKMGDKRTLNNTYLSASLLTPDVTEEKFIAAHKQKIGSDLLSTDLVVANVTVNRISVSADAEWTANIGTLDDQGHQQALNFYNQNHQQWTIAKQQWDSKKGEIVARASSKNTEEARMAIQEMRGHGMSSTWTTYPVKEPTKPDIKNYISYSRGAGSCSSSVDNQMFIAATSTLLFDSRTEVDPKELNKNLLDLYGEILPRVIKGDIKISLNIDSYKFNSISDEDCVASLSGAVQKGLKKNASSQMGKYDKDLELGSWTYSMSKESGEFVVVLVRSTLKNGKTRVSIHDIMHPEIVLSVI